MERHGFVRRLARWVLAAGAVVAALLLVSMLRSDFGAVERLAVFCLAVLLAVSATRLRASAVRP